MPERDTKQVIVIRKDLKMRRGKEIAQGAHASMAFLSRKAVGWAHGRKVNLTLAEETWMTSSFKKITVYVNSEEELLNIEFEAVKAGLTVHTVTDSGLTEFHGVPTLTACAIGPNWSDEIDKITGHLPLY